MVLLIIIIVHCFCCFSCIVDDYCLSKLRQKIRVASFDYGGDAIRAEFETSWYHRSFMIVSCQAASQSFMSSSEVVLVLLVGVFSCVLCFARNIPPR